MIYRCNLTHNIARGNTKHGICISSGSDNVVYGNRIGFNGDSNAYDDGDLNSWDDEVSLGNYWSDYRGDGTYSIPGTAGSIDHYPLWWTGASLTLSIEFVLIMGATVGAASVLLVFLFRKSNRASDSESLA